MTEEHIKVLITDDQVIVRKGIQALLATEPTIKTVGEAENGAAGLPSVFQRTTPKSQSLPL